MLFGCYLYILKDNLYFLFNLDFLFFKKLLYVNVLYLILVIR